MPHKLNQTLASILGNAQAALRFVDSDNLDMDELKDILRDIVNDDKKARDVIRTFRPMVKREEESSD